MHAPTTRTKTHMRCLVVLVALVASACGGGASDTASGDQAAVAVGAVESGCAEAINLSGLLNGIPHPSMTAGDMRQLADGAASLSGSFSDPPENVSTYMSLVEDVVGRAADAAEQRSNPTAEQILLLLDLEMAGHVADFDRLTPEADEFFAAECGASYTKAVAVIDDANTVVATTDDPTPADNAVVAADATGELAATDDDVLDPAVAEAVLVSEDSSSGANGTFLDLEIDVEDIIRTNLTPDAALNGGSELGDGDIVMVGVRLSNNSSGFLFVPLSSYAWASDDGIRMTPIGAVAPTGADWDGTVDGNEAKRGYFIFSADVGATEGAYLQVGDSDIVLERIPLGQGAVSSVYPVELPSGQAGSGILTNGASSDCEYPTDFEVRRASATLNGFNNLQVIRPAKNERFVSLEVAVKVQEVTGNACDWATTVYGNLTDIRLQLDNGDLVPPTAPDFRGEVGTTEVVTLIFPVPADTTAFDLVVYNAESVASWTDIILPDE